MHKTNQTFKIIKTPPQQSTIILNKHKTFPITTRHNRSTFLKELSTPVSLLQCGRKGIYAHLLIRSPINLTIDPWIFISNRPFEYASYRHFQEASSPDRRRGRLHGCHGKRANRNANTLLKKYIHLHTADVLKPKMGLWKLSILIRFPSVSINISANLVPGWWSLACGLYWLRQR